MPRNARAKGKHVDQNDRDLVVESVVAGNGIIGFQYTIWMMSVRSAVRSKKACTILLNTRTWGRCSQIYRDPWYP